MKPSLFFLLFVPICVIAQQRRPFNEKEKLWLDSISNLLEKHNECFDSLMRDNGKCWYDYSEEAKKRKDTVPDIFCGWRPRYPEGQLVIDGEPDIFFQYLILKKEIHCYSGCEKIFLKPSGPIVFDIWRGSVDYPGIYGAFIRQGKDTLYSSERDSKNTFVNFPGDSSRYIIFADNSHAHFAVANIVIGKKEKTFEKNFWGKNSVLIECDVDTLISNTISYSRGKKIQLLFQSDSAEKIKTGDTLLQRFNYEELYDTIAKRVIKYGMDFQAYPFTADKIEEVVFFTGNFGYSGDHFIHRKHWGIFHAKKYRLIRRNQFYRDPVFRYLKKEKIWEHY